MCTNVILTANVLPGTHTYQLCGKSLYINPRWEGGDRK